MQQGRTSGESVSPDGSSRNGSIDPSTFATDVGALDGHPVVAVRGEIDWATVGEFSQAVERAPTERGRLVIDLRETTFMDSSAIVVLERASRRLGQLREALVLHGPNEVARRVLDIMGTTQLVTIRDGPQADDLSVVDDPYSTS